MLLLFVKPAKSTQLLRTLRLPSYSPTILLTSNFALVGRCIVSEVQEQISDFTA